MMAGQAVNLCGSVTALAGALAFVFVYTLFAPWRRYQVGKLLVFKALVISAFMIVSIMAYVIDPGNGRHITPLLFVRGALAFGFGIAMLYQTYLVSSTQMKGASRDPGDI